MVLSQYCSIYNEPQGTAIIFSTKTGTFVRVPRSMLAEINAGNISDEEQGSLAKLGLLVSDHDSERQDMLRMLDERAAQYKGASIVFVMNLDCNLGCWYCYEGKRKNGLYLSRQMADKAIDFIRQSILPFGNQIGVSFYGGEPLLSFEMMVYLAERISGLVGGDGVFSGNMVTNGTLMTPSKATILKNRGITDIQVTLDGPKETHDLSRPFKTGKGSFDIIVRNIRSVCDILNIDLTANYTKENYLQFPKLLDYLGDNGLAPEKLASVRFSPVMGETSEFVSPEISMKCARSDDEWIIEAHGYLREEALKRGYKSSLTAPSLCPMHDSRNLTINHNGDIYRCPGYLGREKFVIGNVETGLVDSIAYKLNSWKNDECLSCKYLPMCFGGCRYQNIIEDEQYSALQCRRAYLEKSLSTLLKQDVTYALNSSGG